MLIRKTILLFFLVLASVSQAQNFQLYIKGQDSTENSLIQHLKYRKNQPSFLAAEKETDNLLYRLQKKGYLEAFEKQFSKVNDSSFVAEFSLGKKHKFIRVEFPKNFSGKKILSKISSKVSEDSFRLPADKIEENLQYLNEQLANRGKPFQYVQLKHFRKNKNGKLTAKLKTNNPQGRTLDQIVVKGYDQFPTAFIQHFLRIKKGSVFNKAKLDQKVERLDNLRFAKSIRAPEILFTQDSTSLYLYLEKRNSNLFDGFLGLSTEEENGDLQLTGYLNLQLVNNLNYGESLSILYRNDGNNQQRFQANLKLEYLFGSPFGFEGALELFRKDTTYTTTDQKLKLTYQLDARTKLKTGYRNSTSNYLLEENEQVAGTTLADFKANYILAGLDYIDINDYNALIPIRTAIDLELQTGKRSRKHGDSKQYIINFRGNHIFQLNPRNSIYINNETAYLNSNQYLENELFRFGGINSMRGFEENSLLATFYSSWQTEYRYLLSSTLYAHSIIDASYFENRILKKTDKLLGIGFGLGLKTKAGLLKVDFANGKAENQKFDFKNTKVHLSLIAVF